MADNHDGFCCSDCARAAARGESAQCDGETCKVGGSTGSVARASFPSRGMAMVSGRASAARADAFMSRGTGYAAVQKVPEMTESRETGCACATPKVVGRPYLDPVLMRMPGTGSVRGTGAVSLTYPDGLPGSRAEAAWMENQPGETDAEATARANVYGESLRRSGETLEQWNQRVRILYNGTSGPGRRWLDAMALTGRFPGLVQTPTDRPGVISGSGTQTSTQAGASANTATQNANQTAVINGVVSAIASAGNTALQLVREANQHDARVRAQEAEAAAARIARNDSREAMLIAAVREATAAGFEAQTALRTLRAGDRMAAITQLSAAQGKLAGAVGTATAFASSGTLNSAIATATSQISSVSAELDRFAPVDLPANNPLNNLSNLNIGGLNQQPWYAQPVVWLGAAAAALLAVVAGRR